MLTPLHCRPSHASSSGRYLSVSPTAFPRRATVRTVYPVFLSESFVPFRCHTQLATRFCHSALPSDSPSNPYGVQLIPDSKRIAVSCQSKRLPSLRRIETTAATNRPRTSTVSRCGRGASDTVLNNIGSDSTFQRDQPVPATTSLRLIRLRPLLQ